MNGLTELQNSSDEANVEETYFIMTACTLVCNSLLHVTSRLEM